MNGTTKALKTKEDYEMKDNAVSSSSSNSKKDVIAERFAPASPAMTHDLSVSSER